MRLRMQPSLCAPIGATSWRRQVTGPRRGEAEQSSAGMWVLLSLFCLCGLGIAGFWLAGTQNASEKRDVDTRLKELESQVQDKRDSFNREIVKVRGQFDDQVLELQQQTDLLEDEARRLRVEVRTLEGAERKAESDVKRLKTRLRSAEEQRDYVAKEIEDVREDMEKLAAEADAMAAQTNVEEPQPQPNEPETAAAETQPEEVAEGGEDELTDAEKLIVKALKELGRILRDYDLLAEEGEPSRKADGHDIRDVVELSAGVDDETVRKSDESLRRAIQKMRQPVFKANYELKKMGMGEFEFETVTLLETMRDELAPRLEGE